MILEEKKNLSVGERGRKRKIPLPPQYLLTIFLQSNDSNSIQYDGEREGRVKNKLTERGDEGEKGVREVEMA